MVCPIDCAALIDEVCELLDDCCGNVLPVAVAETIQAKLLLCIASSSAGGGGTSCLAPLYVHVCNDIEVTLDNGSSCLDPIFTNICTSVLPTGASTSALQTTGNASLTSIDAKIPALGQALMAASLPVVIASNQSAIAVTAASLPLPAGAATEATLSAINTKILPAGQALMAASAPVVIASNQTAIPISAASLPLPTGAATAALQTQPGVDIGDVTVNNAAGAAAVNIQDGGNSITIDAVSLPLPTGAATAALQTQPGVDIGDVTVNNAAGAAAVNIQDGGNSITVDGTVTATIAANQSVNVNQLAGTTTSVNNGTSDAGTLRVTIASNSTGQVALAAGAATIGSLAANQSVNVAQMNGVATTMGTGASGTGVQRVVLTDDNLSTAKISGITLHDAGGTATNPVLVGALARTTNPTAVASDDLTRILATLGGAQLVQPFGLIGEAKTGSVTWGSHTAATTIIAAQGVGFKLVITDITIANADATAQQITIGDGTNAIDYFSMPAAIGTYTKSYPGGMVLPDNTPIQFLASAAGTTGTAAAAHGYKVPS